MEQMNRLEAGCNEWAVRHASDGANNIARIVQEGKPYGFEIYPTGVVKVWAGSAWVSSGRISGPVSITKAELRWAAENAAWSETRRETMVRLLSEAPYDKWADGPAA